MKNKGVIIQLSLEIIAMCITIFITIPIWSYFNADDQSKIASYYDNYYYVESDIIKTDGPYKVILRNESNTLEQYNLVLKVKENKNTNYNDLIININNKDIYIKDLKQFTKGAYKYIILDKSSIVAGKTEYDVTVYNKDIDYTIDVLEKI